MCLCFGVGMLLNSFLSCNVSVDYTKILIFSAQGESIPSGR